MIKRYIPLAVFLVFALTVASCGRHEKHKKMPPPPSAPSSPVAANPAPKAVPAPPPTTQKEAGVVIIIDDMGGDLRALDDILALPGPVAVAVLPQLRHSEETAKRAQDAGREVILHLPMQPKGSLQGLGPGALMKGMGPEEIKENLSKDLASVPGAAGVNNHMGSLLTEDEGAMDALMVELKARKLYFVDSRTTAGSVACEAASRDGVPSASREIFLDNSANEDDIKTQLGRLINLAKKRGVAIAIGHPRPATLKVLKEELPRLSAEGVRVARLNEALK